MKLGRHWNGLKIEIWDLQDLHSNTVYLVLKGEIIFTPLSTDVIKGWPLSQIHIVFMFRMSHICQ